MEYAQALIETEVSPEFLAVSSNSENPLIVYSDGNTVCSTSLKKGHSECTRVGSVEAVGLMGDKPTVIAENSILIFSKKMRISRKIRMKKKPRIVMFYRDGFLVFFDGKVCFKYITKEERAMCMDTHIKPIHGVRHDMKKGAIVIEKGGRVIDVDIQRKEVSASSMKGELLAVDGKKLAVYNDGLIEVGRMTNYARREEAEFYGIMKPLYTMRADFKPEMMFFVCNTLFLVKGSELLAISRDGRKVYSLSSPIISGSKAGKNLALATKKHIFFFVRGCKVGNPVRHLPSS